MGSSDRGTSAIVAPDTRYRGSRCDFTGVGYALRPTRRSKRPHCKSTRHEAAQPRSRTPNRAGLRLVGTASNAGIEHVHLKRRAHTSKRCAGPSRPGPNSGTRVTELVRCTIAGRRGHGGCTGAFFGDPRRSPEPGVGSGFSEPPPGNFGMCFAYCSMGERRGRLPILRKAQSPWTTSNLLRSSPP
jgi:hypothetical protein